MSNLDLKLKKEFLEKERLVLKDYLVTKLQTEDWHGVQDAASDLRDIDSSLAMLAYLTLCKSDRAKRA